MATRTIGIVLVRLFAIYLALSAVRSSISVMSYSSQFGRIEQLESPFWLITGLLGSGVFVPAVSAALVWVLSDRLVPRIDEASVTASNTAIGAQDLMFVGVSLLGCFIFVFGVVEFANVEFRFYVRHVLADNYEPDEFFERLRKFELRVPYIVQVGLGALMLVGRRRVASLLSKAKYLGTGAS